MFSKTKNYLKFGNETSLGTQSKIDLIFTHYLDLRSSLNKLTHSPTFCYFIGTFKSLTVIINSLSDMMTHPALLECTDDDKTFPILPDLYIFNPNSRFDITWLNIFFSQDMKLN